MKTVFAVVALQCNANSTRCSDTSIMLAMSSRGHVRPLRCAPLGRADAAGLPWTMAGPCVG